MAHSVGPPDSSTALISDGVSRAPHSSHRSPAVSMLCSSRLIARRVYGTSRRMRAATECLTALTLGGLHAARSEVGEHRQDAAVIVVGGGEVELAEDVGHVLLDGAERNHQLARDGGVGPALGDE